MHKDKMIVYKVHKQCIKYFLLNNHIIFVKIATLLNE